VEVIAIPDFSVIFCTNRREIMKHKFNISIIITLTILLNFTVKFNFAQGNDNSIKPYTIVSVNDLSIKAFTKKVSDYSASELKRLPLNIRKEYRIVIPSDISKEELKATMKHLVVLETEKDPDIDEIIVFAYDRKEDSESVYTFGKMEWCPYGTWGSVTPNIASSNDRSSYKYVYHITDKVGKISATSIPTKREFSIYDSFEKALSADQNIDEGIVKLKVAKELGISVEEIDRICIKVLTYKMQ